VWARYAVSQLRGGEGAEFRFDSNGISMATQGHHFQHTWGELYRCIETTNVIAIYTTPTMVMVVPKRAFSAEEQLRLRTSLLRHVPNRNLPNADIWRPLTRKALLWLVFLCVFLAVWRVLNQS
jgi:hypothetical protein